MPIRKFVGYAANYTLAWYFDIVVGRYLNSGSIKLKPALNTEVHAYHIIQKCSFCIFVNGGQQFMVKT